MREAGSGKRDAGSAERRLEIVAAGLVAYGEALEWQRELAHERIAGRLDHDVLLLLEHPSVVTVGRAGGMQHVRNAAGVHVIEVERGGDVTYHGPGQLVGYPILDLTSHRMDLHWYLRSLEAVLIAALASLGVAAQRRTGHTGVWTTDGPRKIASIGVHVKQWVTWHGFALNVTTNLAEFSRIVPCGLPDVEMTSVSREAGSGKREALMARSVSAVVQQFERVFAVTAHAGDVVAS